LYLFEGAKYPQSVYFICQAIEKLLKAYLIEFQQIRPEKIHRLEKLAIQTKLQFSSDQLNQLEQLTIHYNRIRYPDYSQEYYNTRAKVEPIINQGKTLYLWIKVELENH